MVDARGMGVLLLLTSPPSTLRVVGGGSAAGPSHSRTSRDVRLESAKWAKADVGQVAVTSRSTRPSSGNVDRLVGLSRLARRARPLSKAGAPPEFFGGAGSRRSLHYD